MVVIHPRWLKYDLTLLGQRLRASLNLSSIELISANGNLVWSDRSSVYKLTLPKFRRRSVINVHATSCILNVIPGFPTPRPLWREVRDMDFGPSGRWALTAWEYMDIVPLTPGRHDTESYFWLGDLLKRLHRTAIPNLSRHDPLQLTEEIVDKFVGADAPGALEDRDGLEVLRERYNEEFPPWSDVTVHGDIHWHQVAKDKSGTRVLLDFENVAMGSPSVDLVPSAGWVRRTGHPSDAQLRALEDGYGGDFPRLSPAQINVVNDIRNFALEIRRKEFARVGEQA